VTDEGMIIAVIFEQLEKASSPISVTVLGIEISPDLPGGQQISVERDLLYKMPSDDAY
jgi:hypothetical protein